MTVLMNATNQWSNRPADERFSSIGALHAAALGYRQNAAVATIKANALSVLAKGDDIILNGEKETARLTNWAFGQLCERAKAPAAYLTGLPSPLAVDCLNLGLKRQGDEETAALLFDRRGGLTARAFTSEKYARIWNSEVTSRLIKLEQDGPWQPAPAAFDGSRGLYLGDRDMFAFLVDNERRIFEKDQNGGLSRGFFTWNSETRGGSFGFMSFLYEYVCGNHRVWGASNVNEIRVRHVGDADERAFRELAIELRKYADSSAAGDEAKVELARNYQIAATKAEVLDTVFGLRIPGLSRRNIEAGYDLAEKRVDWYGSPRSAWGLAGGLTEIARDLPNADERVALDRASAKVMEIAF